MIKPRPSSQGDAWPADARLLLLLTALWSVVGLLILASASWWSAQQELGDSLYYVKRQTLWLLTGWCLLLIIVRWPLRQWLRLSAVGLLAGLTLLVLTIFFGVTINGASRWLLIGPVQMQPSELIKPLVILQ
ncbi:MAG: cell division protein FtsW, partial [Synechococcus sp. SB0665_bin_28]|nr:cell division protein FtsW [Synechococcus sp. SB0665_bin_28]